MYIYIYLRIFISNKLLCCSNNVLCFWKLFVLCFTFSEERYEYAKKLKNTIQELQKVNHWNVNMNCQELQKGKSLKCKYELSRITKGKSLKCKYELSRITKGKSLKCKYELSRITKGKSLKCKYELWGWFTPYKQCKLQVSCRWHNVLKMPVSMSVFSSPEHKVLICSNQTLSVRSLSTIALETDRPNSIKLRRKLFVGWPWTKRGWDRQQQQQNGRLPVLLFKISPL